MDVDIGGFVAVMIAAVDSCEHDYSFWAAWEIVFRVRRTPQETQFLYAKILNMQIFCCFVVYLQPSLSFRWKDNFTKFYHQPFFFNLNSIFVLINFLYTFFTFKIKLDDVTLHSTFLLPLFFQAFLHFFVCSSLWSEEAVQCAIKQHLRLKDTLYTERQRMRAGK